MFIGGQIVALCCPHQGSLLFSLHIRLPCDHRLGFFPIFLLNYRNAVCVCVSLSPKRRVLGDRAAPLTQTTLVFGENPWKLLRTKAAKDEPWMRCHILKLLIIMRRTCFSKWVLLLISALFPFIYMLRISVFLKKTSYLPACQHHLSKNFPSQHFYV